MLPADVSFQRWCKMALAGPCLLPSPSISIACGETLWLVQLWMQCWRSCLLWQECACSRGEGVPSKSRAPLHPSGVLAVPQTWRPTCTQLLRVTSHCSHISGVAVPVSCWPSGMSHSPRKPYHSLSSELECCGTSEGAARWLLSPSNPTLFLLFLFFSVGQVVNIKAKVNRAFNSSMEVGVCPCPCPHQLQILPRFPALIPCVHSFWLALCGGMWVSGEQSQLSGALCPLPGGHPGEL